MGNSSEINGVDYGPLAGLVGTWKGDKGMDVSPEPDGKEESPYHETIRFEAIGDATNAKSQTLAVVRYHQVVSRKSNDQVFHDEVGYWMWDAKAEIIMHSLAIPRAVCVLAGGKFATASLGGSSMKLQVEASLGSKDWGIVQSPFMQAKAKTTGFKHEILIEGDKLSYSETVALEIYGKSFDHTDQNSLTRSS